jgi:hypothetical protein
MQWQVARRKHRPAFAAAIALGLLSLPGQAADDSIEVPRRVPGEEPPQPYVAPKVGDPNARGGLSRIPIPDGNQPADFIPIPDRWRLAVDLGLIRQRWFDPYNNNILKGDRPFIGRDWFISLGFISDTVIEPRSTPLPVAPQGAAPLDQLSADRNQLIFQQNFLLPIIITKGDTVFEPPIYEFRITPVINVNHVDVSENRVLFVDPTRGSSRTDSFVGIQELFFDYHLRNVSARFDFDSVRFGIQPFSSDFRGFLFQDLQLGVRLFGNRDNNLWQYNIAWFRRLEKDTNSGLNDITQAVRDDDIFAFNLYRQDFPFRGFTSQGTVMYNRNREGDNPIYFDDNGFVARPAVLGTVASRNYDVTYIGYNGDGHYGRFNLTVSAYGALGTQTASAFRRADTNVRGIFAAGELSYDMDWLRPRVSILYASGDKDPFDNTDTGFDAIFENPIFAGADTSYWIRQNVPNVGGGGVALSGRNGVLNSLRSSKELGQSNFANPGIQIYGAGVDADVLPELRVSANLNKLYFDNTAVLNISRQRVTDPDIGWDVSGALIWRPYFSQNVVARLSGAVLVPGEGLTQMYGSSDPLYSVLANIVLTY